MQHEFDNTFDALLRRAAARAQGEVLPESNAHLDADSLAAFAENVLPAATRANFAAHLADCADCREILTTFVSIQEAEETVTVETKEIVAAPLGWKQRFARWFALPNLGYAAAALTVLFIGVFGFIAFQSNQKTAAPEVEIADAEAAGKLAEKRRAAPVQEAPQPEPTPETQENSNNEALATLADNSNLAANSNQADAQSPNRGLPPSYQGITGQTSGEQQARRDTEPQRNSRAPQTEPATSTNAASSATASAPAGQPQPTPLVSARPAEKVAAQAAPPSAAEAQSRDEEAKKVESVLDSQRAKVTSQPVNRNSAVAPRTVGGKTFLKLGGVWRDSAFNGQKAENVARGSEEYKKLDAGLRSVAEGFAGETVIVVWQGKAYRIR